MAGYVILGMLAAFGTLSLIWTVLGWLLPGGKGCAVVCLGLPDSGMVYRYRWLRSLGLVAWPMVLVAEKQEPAYWETEICSWEELYPRLERERSGSDGTGNGDHTGRHQRCGISEL